MNRWKSLITHRWRAKLVSLAVAALLWLAIRQAMPPSPADPAFPAEPSTPRAVLPP